MKLFVKIFLLFLLLSYSGCENSDLVEIQLPFQEKVIVQAQFVASNHFKGMRITKTLPVNENYTISKAEVKNALVYLLINDVKVIPLNYTSEGIYLPIDTLTVLSNDKIELLGDINGTPFYSQTFVPNIPVVLHSDYNSELNYMEATVRAEQDEVYGAIWMIDMSEEISAEDFYSISSPVNNSTEVLTRTTLLPEIYQSSGYNGRRFIQVYAFDKQFKAFFNSKNNNQPVSNYFIEGGGSISWNVQGDNVIGLFIGMAKNRL